MSVELFVFLCKSKLSNRDSWQTEIGKHGYGLSIDPNLKVFEDEDFVPCALNGAQIGFEIFFGDAIAVASNQPELKSKLNGRDLCIVFRWGGDLNEAASALIASLALIDLADAVVYYPADDIYYNKSLLIEDIAACQK